MILSESIQEVYRDFDEIENYDTEFNSVFGLEEDEDDTVVFDSSQIYHLIY